MDFTLDEKNRKIITGPKFDGHVGRRALEHLKKNKDGIHQIEVSTGESETHGSVLLKSVRLAQTLKSKNIAVGDVIWNCSTNHFEAGLPLISSTYIGSIFIGLAVGMTYAEIKHILSLAVPKVVFTDKEMIKVIKKVLDDAEIDVKIVVYGDKCDDFNSFSEYIEPTGTEDSFRCEEFDPETTIAFASLSSGTTGMQKLVSMTHQTIILIIRLPELMAKNRQPFKYYMNFSPMVWITGIISVLYSCFLGNTRLQSRKPFSIELVRKAINEYKPEIGFLPPVALSELKEYPELDKIDFSCFRNLMTGGCKVSDNLVDHFRKLVTNGIITIPYGTSEAGSVSANTSNVGYSVGKPALWIHWKIVDPDTEERLGPNQHGEIRVKSQIMFQGYYNDPVSTANSFDSENYYKTGDIMYCDDEGNLHYVDRLKEIIKYRNFQVSPVEIEILICTLPEVMAAAVIGYPDTTSGELPMAIVQLFPGAKIEAQRIKDLVNEKLSDSKQLRGGVVFMNQLPMTHSEKVDRKALKKVIAQLKRE